MDSRTLSERDSTETSIAKHYKEQGVMERYKGHVVVERHKGQGSRGEIQRIENFGEQQCPKRNQPMKEDMIFPQIDVSHHRSTQSYHGFCAISSCKIKYSTHHSKKNDMNNKVRYGIQNHPPKIKFWLSLYKNFIDSKKQSTNICLHSVISAYILTRISSLLCHKS